MFSLLMLQVLLELYGRGFRDAHGPLDDEPDHSVLTINGYEHTRGSSAPLDGNNSNMRSLEMQAANGETIPVHLSAGLDVPVRKSVGSEIFANAIRTSHAM
mmetsp:Transcript_63120/g.104946  ORF Transcript_63120/g.104946 Transcript_63120/m.104946 type:complete len:101 (+) Transcript_63120:2-304(+)